METEQKLLAFWSYDLFPYIKYGTVTSFTSDGKVHIKEYGNGIFTPLKIFPYDSGIEIAKAIDELHNEHFNKIKEINDTYTKFVENVIGMKVK